MRREPAVISLLSFAAAAGMLWAIVWGGIAFIVAFLNLFDGRRPDWWGAAAGGAACLLIGSAGAATALGATRLVHHVRAHWRPRRGFEVIASPAAAAAAAAAPVAEPGPRTKEIPA
jgi:hypothetical protein